MCREVASECHPHKREEEGVPGRLWGGQQPGLPAALPRGRGGRALREVQARSHQVPFSEPWGLLSVSLGFEAVCVFRVIISR